METIYDVNSTETGNGSPAFLVITLALVGAGLITIGLIHKKTGKYPWQSFDSEDIPYGALPGNSSIGSLETDILRGEEMSPDNVKRLKLIDFYRKRMRELQQQVPLNQYFTGPKKSSFSNKKTGMSRVLWLRTGSDRTFNKQ